MSGFVLTVNHFLKAIPVSIPCNVIPISKYQITHTFQFNNEIIFRLRHTILLCRHYPGTEYP
jgi:flagellar motor switch protein FliM